MNILWFNALLQPIQEAVVFERIPFLRQTKHLALPSCTGQWNNWSFTIPIVISVWQILSDVASIFLFVKGIGA